jgi:hypothetical protein
MRIRNRIQQLKLMRIHPDRNLDPVVRLTLTRIQIRHLTTVYWYDADRKRIQDPDRAFFVNDNQDVNNNKITKQ